MNLSDGGVPSDFYAAEEIATYYVTKYMHFLYYS